MKISRILVPTDFSEEANNALYVAVQVARKFSAEVTLLHVIDVPLPEHYQLLDPVLSNAPAQLEDHGIYKVYMQKLMEATKEKISEIREEYQGVNLKEHIVFDSLAKHLASFVKRDDTDLIVIGSKGASGIDEVLIGSNTERVIRTAKAPVLVVKNKIKDFNLENIVFASSFAEVPNLVADFTLQFVKAFDAKIHFLKVITPNTFEITPETENAIQEFAIKRGFENYTINGFNYFSEEEGIRAFAERKDADMIIMYTHGRTGLAHLMLGSITESVANHSVLPLLSFNSHTK